MKQQAGYAVSEKEVADKLNSLIQLDIDAVHGYNQALEHIDVPTVKDRISEFRDDHQRHIRDLSSLVASMGEKPPEFSPDFKGYIIKGFTSFRSAMGTEGAIKAIEMNEKLTNKKYSEATTWDLSAEAMNLVDRNYEDEKKHLAYIEQALRERPWK
jgi:uncharacterized protein (TIGR02284 family)